MNVLRTSDIEQRGGKWIVVSNEQAENALEEGWSATMYVAHCFWKRHRLEVELDSDEVELFLRNNNTAAALVIYWPPGSRRIEWPKPRN